MVNKLSATKKGLITGIAMIVLALVFVFAGLPFSGSHQYGVYLVYTAGIIWTLVSFDQVNKDNRSFKTHFGEGFRCFIVAALLMVIYTFIVLKTHTVFRDTAATAFKQQLELTGDKTPAEVTTLITQMKEKFAVVITGGAVFVYLIIGSLVTAITSAFLTRNKS
jgi:NADH:ubiquinone oxidoreductase subunit 6 (subunit J)